MDKISQPLRVLLVEDNPSDAELMLRELRRARFEPEAKRVDTEEEYRAALSTDVDLILSDYAMPQFSGLRALDVLKESNLDIPFIIVSGSIGEDTAVIAMRSGAADYLLKDRLTRLGQAVENALEQKEHQNERRRAEAAMHQSEHKYRHLFESLSEAAFLIDTKSRRIIDANLCAEKMLGLTRSQILGMYEKELFPPNQAVNYCKTLSKTGAGGEDVLGEAEIQSKDGTTIPVRVSVAPIELYGRNLVLALMVDLTERKRAEEALGSLQRQSELILNSAGEGIYGVDLAGNINFVNPKAAQLLGWSASEFLGKPAHATLHHSHANGSEYSSESCPILMSMLDGAPHRVTNDSFWRKDGTSFRTDYVAAPIKDADGRIAGSIVTFKDITQEFAAEMRLKLQEQQYRLLFETNPNPMWVFDSKSERILAVNQVACTQYGYSKSEFLELRLKDLRPPNDVTDLLKAKALSSPQPMSHYSGQFRHLLKDGSMILVEIFSGAIIWEGRSARIVTAIDVTERKRAEERLLEQADIINRAQDAIIVREFESQRITLWSAGAEKLYGWSASEAVGRPIGELLFADATDREAPLKRLLTSGEFHGELEHITKDGREIIVDSRVTLVRDPDGSPRSVLAINTDITEHKKLETQLLRAQRLESIGTLAAGVAHDLNNVLTPILMCAEVLQTSVSDEDSRRTLTLIDESARRGAAIVKQVLTFARGIEGERVLMRPKHLIEEMIDIAQKTFPKSIQITARYAEDLWSIEGDPTQLHQVLLNLAVNARDAMTNGGSLTIAAENFNVDEHYASMMPDAKPGAHVVLRVSDTGTGMPAALIDKIFDPFFTTKEVGKGTGLGLSTVLGIVKSHRGFISVYSETGNGTSFRVFLPAQISDEVACKSETPLDSLEGNGETILVVDDEPNILQITRTIFEKHNYRVVSANDGPEALALFAQQMPSIGGVLTDIAMPYMDGVALVRALKKMKADIPIIASSGQGDQPGVVQLQSLGVKNFLSKPYNTEKLLATVQETLQGRDPTELPAAKTPSSQTKLHKPDFACRS